MLVVPFLRQWIFDWQLQWYAGGRLFSHAQQPGGPPQEQHAAVPGPGDRAHLRVGQLLTHDSVMPGPGIGLPLHQELERHADFRMMETWYQ